MLYHHQIILEGTEAYRHLRREGRIETGWSFPYEGTACFKSPDVATLADIMRQITNILFTCMDGIWSGRTIEPPGSRVKIWRTRLLVNIFDESLCALESGERFDAARIASLVGKPRGRSPGF